MAIGQSITGRGWKVSSKKQPIVKAGVTGGVDNAGAGFAKAATGACKVCPAATAVSKGQTLSARSWSSMFTTFWSI